MRFRLNGRNWRACPSAAKAGAGVAIIGDDGRAEVMKYAKTAITHELTGVTTSYYDYKHMNLSACGIDAVCPSSHPCYAAAAASRHL